MMVHTAHDLQQLGTNRELNYPPAAAQVLTIHMQMSFLIADFSEIINNLVLLLI